MDERNRLLKIFARFARKSHNDIGRNRDVAASSFHPRNAFQILVAGVKALHRVQDLGRSTLNRQMNVVAEPWEGFNSIDDVFREISWVGSRKPDTLDSGDFRDRDQQFSKASLSSRIPVRVHVLPEQLYRRVAK